MRLICINCPKGCELLIDDKQNVSGNACERGRDYAVAEATHPTRTVTGLVKVEGRRSPLSVKTRRPIPKGEIFRLLDELRGVTVAPPVAIGQEIMPNIIATSSLP